MTPEAAPPLLVLAVKQEDFADFTGLAGPVRAAVRYAPGRRPALAGLGLGARNDRLRGSRRRRYGGRDLRLVALAGRFQARPLDPEGHRARLPIAGHDPWEVLRAPDQVAARAEETPFRQLSRVDIGVFARRLNAAFSVAIAFPAHEMPCYAFRPARTTPLMSVN